MLDLSLKSLPIPDIRIKIGARLGHFLLLIMFFVIVKKTIRNKSAEEKITETNFLPHALFQCDILLCLSELNPFI